MGTSCGYLYKKQVKGSDKEFVSFSKACFIEGYRKINNFRGKSRKVILLSQC